MAGMLVADGAFGLMGWDTKREKSCSCSEQAVNLTLLIKLVVFLYRDF